MTATDAERARRYRRHKAGDHSLCVPSRCAAAGTREVPASNRGDPAFLGPAGHELWQEMTSAEAVSALQYPLLVEACRITDRLEKLDRQLHGEDWLRFRHSESDVEVTVYVDRVLAEAREQATALKGLLAELRQSLGKAKDDKPKGGGVLDDLAARRNARINPPAG